MAEAPRRGAKIFFPDVHLGVSPTVLNLVTALAERSYGCDVFVPRQDHGHPAAELPAGARLIQVPTLYDRARIVRRAVRAGRTLLGGAGAPLEFARNAAAAAGNAARACFNIGVDSGGMLAARLRQKITGEPYLFLSLELPVGGSAAERADAAFADERDAFVHSAAVAVQDADRARVLTEYFGCEHPKTFYLPNGPRDVPRATRRAGPDNYFRTQFGLDSAQYPRIVAQTGMISSEAYSEELALASREVNGAAFVFHERRLRSPEESGIARIRALNSRNLFLSLEPVPYGRLGDVYSSIDVGIAYYRPIDANFSEIAMASGKLAFYLRHGIPAIVNALPSLARLNARYEFGVTVSDPGSARELQSAMDAIAGSYERFARNARECFLAEFEFDRHASPLLRFLDALPPARTEAV